MDRFESLKKHLQETNFEQVGENVWCFVGVDVVLDVVVGQNDVTAICRLTCGGAYSPKCIRLTDCEEAITVVDSVVCW